MSRKIISYLFILLISLVLALNYQLFIFPNSFAPAGLNGLLTIIQHVFGFKLGYANILLNVPLAMILYFTVSKPYAIRAMVSVVSFSVFLLLLDQVDLSRFAYTSNVSALLGPVVAGLISGVGGYYMDKMGSCYGGAEFIAKLVHKRSPSFNIYHIIFVLNASVAVLSYFVYDYKIEPVLLCIIYSYMSSSVRDNMARKQQSAVRCEIVTERGTELGKAIIETFHHSVTEIPGKGLYAGRDKSVLVCVMNPSQVAELTKLVATYPGSFVTLSHVNTVVGNFKRLDSHNMPEKELLDPGAVQK